MTLEQRLYGANIPRYHLQRALGSFRLWMPVWIIYLQHQRGLNLTEITLLDTTFWIAMAISEIPTGVVADTFGRRISMAIGSALIALTYLVYTWAPTFALLIAANVLWAVASSFLSGAEQAFLYSTLKTLDREADYAKVAGQAQVYAQGSWIVSSLLGGVIGAINLTLPFLLATIVTGLRCLVILTLREPPDESGAAARRRYVDTLRDAAQIVGAHAPLRYTLAYASILPLASLIVVIIFQQPHALALGVPIAGMGLLTLANRGAAMAGSGAAGRLVERVGERRLLVAAPIVTIAGLVALAAMNSLAGLLLFVVVAFVSAVMSPLIEGLVLRESPSNTRATLMSMQSLLLTLTLAVVEPTMGVVADRRGLPAAYLVLAGIMTFTLLPLLVLRERWARPAPVAEPAAE